jgi:hypothetical protein
MYNIDTDLLFPPRVIPALRSLRGPAWRELIDRVMEQEPAGLDRLAFVLLMIRLGGCISCHADSFRALRGCTHCAYQTIRRYRGSDQELLELFAEAKAEVSRYLEKPVEG